MLYSIARKLNARDASVESDDLVNEGFLHLFEDDFRRLKGFQFKSKLSTYIYTVVRRHLISKISRLPAGKEPANLPEQPERAQQHWLEWDSLFSTDTESDLMKKEVEEFRRSAFNRALETLSPQEQLQIAYHMDGCSTDKIIKLMKFSDRARLDKRKFNIMQKLKKEIHKIEIEARYAR